MSDTAQPQVGSSEQVKSALESAKKDLKNRTPDARKYAVKRDYDKLMGKRRPYLDEARELSQAIMSFLYPPEGTTNPFAVASPNQSMVVKGLINLTKKLSSTIFPANGRFFANRILPMYAKQLEALKAQMDEEGLKEVVALQTDTNNRLINRDDIIRQKIKSSNDAENNFHATLHVLAGGEACFCKPNLESSKVYTIENFVCEYDSAGNSTHVIVRDNVHVSNFSPEQLKKLFGTDDLEVFEHADITEIPVFTRQIRRHDCWEIQVEVLGERFEEMEGKEELDSPPFIIIPFMLIPGKDHGVSYCSINKGDIFEFENLNLTINELTKVASKCLVHLPSQMKLTQKELAKLEDGGGIQVVTGDGQYLPSMILADISKNLGAIQGVFEQTRAALMQAFLMEQAVVRDAERVTQEEIKTVMEGLTNLLGGLYLSIARRFQYPYIKRVVRLMEYQGEIEPFPKEVAELVLTAGQESLEDQDNLQRLDAWAGPYLQAPELMAKVNMDELGTRRANYLGVSAENLLLSDEQLYEKQGIAELVKTAQGLGPQGPQMLSQLVAALPSIMASGSLNLAQQQPQEAQATPPEQAGLEEAPSQGIPAV